MVFQLNLLMFTRLVLQANLDLVLKGSKCIVWKECEEKLELATWKLHFNCLFFHCLKERRIVETSKSFALTIGLVVELVVAEYDHKWVVASNWCDHRTKRKELAVDWALSQFGHNCGSICFIRVVVMVIGGDGSMRWSNHWSTLCAIRIGQQYFKSKYNLMWPMDIWVTNHMLGWILIDNRNVLKKYVCLSLSCGYTQFGMLNCKSDRF